MPRLILYNIEYCEGTTKSSWQYFDLYHVFRSRKSLDDRIIKFLETKNPDILALVEIDNGSKRAKRRNETSYFGEMLGFNYITHAVKYATEGITKIFTKMPVLKHQENALLTKYPVEDIKYHRLSKGTKNIVIEATAKLDKYVKILVVHLALFKRTRKKQLRELTNIVNKIEEPLILVGDFNTFKEEELSIIVNNTRLEDSYKKEGFKCNPNTSPSWKPKYRLDNILVSSEVKVYNYEVLDVHYSDHLPVLVDFELK